MAASCSVCSRSDANYICPRCNARYCSVDCYKNHSTQCTDTFYREAAEGELRTLTATEDEKRRMQDILRLLHQQQIEDLEGGSGGSSEGEEESSDDEELVPGLSLHRALLFATGEITLDDLTTEELEAFQKEAFAADGDVAAEVQAWEPWWTTLAAAELQLSASGIKCIEVIVESTAISSAEARMNTGLEDQQIPPPPAAPLPSLSSLISQPPSPALPLHLLDLLYSYCLTLRLFNGRYTTDVLDAANTVLASSSVLGRGSHSKSQSHSLPGTADVPSTVLLNSVMHVCSNTEAGRAQVPRSFAIGILSDVAMVLRHGRPVVVTALTDLSRLVDAGLVEARSCINNESNSPTADKNSLGRMNKEELLLEFQQQDQELKNMITRLKQAQRKMLFFLSWANEVADTVAPALAMAAGMVYEQQRATVVAQNSETKELILPRPTTLTKTSGARG
ncbi:putative Zinc finger HIT domain-containing protein 2 [Nannochloris sp. 'desiccata']|nr:putative Zinc finger HIT domain-containing protein 2 [Chlorella desiccata (nom. nud.)]